MKKKDFIKKTQEDVVLVKGYRPFTKEDMGKRFYAFLIDTSVMLSPIAIWNILMLAIFGNIVGSEGIIVMTIVIGVLLIASMMCLNTYFSLQTKGQSLGMKVYGLRVLGASGKVAYQKKLILREICGFALPFFILMYFTSIFGVMLYWAVNGVFVYFDKQHRSLIDCLVKTKVVTADNHVKQPIRQAVKEVVQKRSVMTTIDLHIHSNFSANGQYNVEEIFQKAKEKGLQIISITDLDCVKSIPIAKRMSELYHIQYIPGIEINCELQGRRIRLLGYFITYPHELYHQIENDSLIHEKQASIERVHKFEELLGISIPVERLLDNNRFQRIPGEMIAEYVLTRSEYRDCPLLQPYVNGRINDPYRSMAKDFFAYDKCCYVPVKYPDIRDVLDVIHLTQGTAVLAHPGKLLATEPDLLKRALLLDIDGMEVFHPSHTKQETTKLLKIAMDRKLFVSAGSDFYGHKSDDMGATGCPEDGEKLIRMFTNAKA